jgi:hypothetical protein
MKNTKGMGAAESSYPGKCYARHLWGEIIGLVQSGAPGEFPFLARAFLFQNAPKRLGIFLLTPLWTWTKGQENHSLAGDSDFGGPRRRRSPQRKN